MTPIRHIASSASEDLFATAAFERSVWVWSFRRKKLVRQFDTILGFGGRRLALTDQCAPILVAGHHSAGVAAYDAINGSLLWCRSDVRGVQNVDEVAFGESGLLGVGIDSDRCHILATRSGRTIAELANAHRVVARPISDVAIVLSQSAVALCRVREWDKRWGMSTCRPILGVGLSNGMFAVSHVAGSVFCRDFDGRVLWEWTPPAGHHVLSLCWHDASATWLGILSNFELGGEKRLIGIDIEGALVCQVSVVSGARAPVEVEFMGTGDYVITSNGEILKVPELALTWRFAKG